MIIMAIDFGDSRTGLAICDPREMLASPAGVIFEKRFIHTIEKAAEKALELCAELIVVGHPINMNGSIGTRAKLCEDFATQIQELSKINTVLWDERSTTVSATHFLNETDTRGKKRKNVIDAVAATIILDNYLAWRRNHPEGELKCND